MQRCITADYAVQAKGPFFVILALSEMRFAQITKGYEISML
jgi:hypothetical protein